MTGRWGRWLRGEPFLLAATILAIAYLVLSLSPSSYQEVLKEIGVEGKGPLWGWTQPIRSDEFAIWTPAVQIAVANHFGPRNETSLYGEELRSLSALPLADWALVFRPQFWGFWALPPAYGLAGYWAFYYWIFAVSWSLFLRRLGVEPGLAAAATLLLLLTPWAQAWWTSFAPLLAMAPLIALPALLPLPAWGRFLLAAYACAAWLLGGLFYPPLYLALGLSLYLAILLFRPAELAPRRWLPLLAGALVGVGLATFYLWRPLLLTAGSVTHGARDLGGGAVFFQHWLATFQPSLSLRGWEPIYGSVLCESVGAGSILWLLIAAFALPFGRAAFRLEEVWSRRGAWLMLGFGALISVWMLFPVPAAFGAPLLLNLTPPTRLLLLPGLLALFLALRFLPRLELRFCPARALAAGAVILIGFLLCHPQFPRDLPWRQRIFDNADLLLIPLILLLPPLDGLVRRLAGLAPPSPPDPRAAAAGRALLPLTLVIAAALGNLLVFGLFNPLQSTRPIFEKLDSPRLAALRAMQEAHRQKRLVVPGFFGSVLNGLGFKSVTHSLLNPQPETFATYFPSLPATELASVFNRYANLQLSGYSTARGRILTRPWAPADNAVVMPYEPFLPKMQVQLEKGAPAKNYPPPFGGRTRIRYLAGRQVTLEVQGPIRPLSGRIWVEIHLDPAPYRLKGSWRIPPEDGSAVLGPDLYKLLVVELALVEPPGPTGLGWCATIHDNDFGIFQLGPLPGQGRSICPP